MHDAGKNLLLINPWIVDFTAYDLWSQPLGLLYIASFLRQAGFRISYIDCLRSVHPQLEKPPGKYGKGNYQRRVVEKPPVLGNIPRRYARYGISEAELTGRLKDNAPPDAVLMTSMMTYWYPGVRHTIQLIRKIYPGIPVILGGVYATLLPDHALQVVRPDYLITGPGEKAVLNLLADLFHLDPPLEAISDNPDTFPYPAFDLITDLRYLCLLTSRGCPYNCSFCAQARIAMHFRQRSPLAVVKEITDQYKKYRIRDFAFYDDALFINKEKHIKPILRDLIGLHLPLRLHTPNGLFTREIDSELAGLMFRSNFKTVRLSFETANENRRKDMYNKISNEGLCKAVENLLAAGYQARDLEAYIIMGLPGQTIDEVLESMLFVNRLGMQISLSSFSPIPGTLDFRRAVESGLIDPDIDPLLTNKAIFPIKTAELNYESYIKVRIFSQLLNEAARKELSPFSDPLIGNSLKRLLSDIR